MIELRHMAKVVMPTTRPDTMRDILGMFTYVTNAGDMLANYHYVGDGVVYLPPNMDKLAKIATMLGQEIEDQRVTGEPVDQEFVLQPEFSLRDYQVEPCKQLHQHIVNNYCGTLGAACGTGKTVVMTRVAGEFGVKILVVVDQSNLVASWADAFRFIWGRELQKIDSATTIVGDCCITTIQLLARNKPLAKSLRGRFGVCLLDECHTVTATTFKAATFGLDSLYRVSCTATFFNKNIPNGALIDIVGDVCVTMEDDNALVPVVEFVKTGEYFHSDDPNEFGNKILPKLAGNEVRNGIAFDLIRSCVVEGRKVLVICIKNDQAKLLHDLCIRSGIRSTVYTGTTTVKRDLQVRNGIADGTYQVLLTSKKMDKGTDIPALDTLINTVPGNNKGHLQQRTGRITRTYKDKKSPKVFDLADEGSLAKGFANNRKRMYKGFGATVIN